MNIFNAIIFVQSHVKLRGFVTACYGRDLWMLCVRDCFTPQVEEQLLIESSSDEEEASDNDNDSTNKEGGGGGPQLSEGLIDVEDMGKVVKKMKAVAKKRRDEEEGRVSGEPREMVTPMLHKALTKQGRDHVAI